MSINIDPGFANNSILDVEASPYTIPNAYTLLSVRRRLAPRADNVEGCSNMRAKVPHGNLGGAGGKMV